ncbi:MAG: creatininase family protein [Spirochaetia bacterium]|nr:creatininase family protein [Spirochaetia bacterium]
MTTNHQWELMLPKEFYEEMTKAPIAYLSFGPMEEHGLHCSMGTDFQISRELCLRAARISGGIAHPTVPLAQPWFPGLSRKEIRDKVIELYPPSLWISRELLESICLEMLESLSELGFKLCVAVSGHYPGEVLLQALEKKIVGKVGPMKFWGT